ncbi:hypothetical protein Tco_0620389 [Tanacetum coccineum]
MFTGVPPHERCYPVSLLYVASIHLGINMLHRNLSPMLPEAVNADSDKSSLVNLNVKSAGEKSPNPRGSPDPPRGWEVEVLNRFPDGEGDGDGDEAEKRGWGW